MPVRQSLPDSSGIVAKSGTCNFQPLARTQENVRLCGVEPFEVRTGVRSVNMPCSHWRCSAAGAGGEGQAVSEPARAGDLAAATGLDKAEVSKAMKILKAEGKIHSPKRCCWAPVD